MHIKNWFLLITLTSVLTACSGGGGSDYSPAPPVADGGDTSDDSGDDGACGISAQIDFVEGVTDTWYLWYDEMANANKADYDSSQAFLEAKLQPLIDDGRDRGFSYMTTVTEDETSISSGAYIGFGFRSTSTCLLYKSPSPRDLL